MLKFLLPVFVFGFMAVGPVFSQSSNTNSEKELSQYEKISFYSQLKYSSKDSLLFSSLFGWGTGSFIQDDWVGGIIGMSADIVGLALFARGFFLSTHLENDQSQLISTICMSSGGALLLSSRIFQIVRPLIIVDEKNKKLRLQLGISVDY